MATTFPVSPVDLCREPLTIPTDMKQPPTLLDRPVEAWGSSAPSTIPVRGNALVSAVHTAFDVHYPLVLTPDALWLAIAQGFAIHVNANAERLRGKFVRHQGKATITVRRDDFVKGSPHNPWPEVFPVFSDKIAEHIGRQRDLVVCDFSTTGPCERAASEIVLMAAMQTYFKFGCMSACGIPEITLEGTVDDWRSIRRRAQALGEYELQWWVDALLPVIDQFIAAAQGQVDTAFWRSIYKQNDGSGGPYATGWINTLFPYVNEYSGGTFRVNGAATHCAKMMDQPFHSGAVMMTLPAGMRTAPFEWQYLGQRHAMEFLGGFVGMSQDPETLALRPAIGWAVCGAAA